VGTGMARHSYSPAVACKFHRTSPKAEREPKSRLLLKGRVWSVGAIRNQSLSPSGKDYDVVATG